MTVSGKLRHSLIATWRLIHWLITQRKIYPRPQVPNNSIPISETDF